MLRPKQYQKLISNVNIVTGLYLYKQTCNQRSLPFSHYIVQATALQLIKTRYTWFFKWKVEAIAADVNRISNKVLVTMLCYVSMNIKQK